MDLTEQLQMMKNESLLEYNERITNTYMQLYGKEKRTQRGQFFTPKDISKFMISFFDTLKGNFPLIILDPGAGTGVFESAICEHMKENKIKRDIEFHLYENDENLYPFLKANLNCCKKVMSAEDIIIKYKILKKDFIISNKKVILDYNKGEYSKHEIYDFIISNPPYKRINSDTIYVKSIQNTVSKTNLYSLFMFFSSLMLKQGGEMLVISPRSFCSGFHFREFRRNLLLVVKPYKIHLFKSRRDIFKEDGVLQENLIMLLKKEEKSPKELLISSSLNGIEKIWKKKIKYNFVLRKTQNDTIIRIPNSEKTLKIAQIIEKFDNKLEYMNLHVANGKVVPFRMKKYLTSMNENKKNEFYPLIWMHNIQDGFLNIEVENKKKPKWIIKSESIQKTLIPNDIYILIKRFSNKEGRKQLESCIYNKNIETEWLGVENHVNYVYSETEDFLISIANGLVSLYNSNLYNTYFKLSNSTTQVNVSQIKEFPLPPKELIIEIGEKRLKSNHLSEEEIEAHIMSILDLDKYKI